MTTTIQIENKLLAEVEAFAAEPGRSLTEVVENALRQALPTRCHADGQTRGLLKTHGNGGLQPGVNLDSTAALLELMDDPYAAS